MSYLLDKCTLDKMRERSKVIKILVPYSCLNSGVLNFVKNNEPYFVSM